MSHLRDLPDTREDLLCSGLDLRNHEHDGFRCLVSKHGDVVRLESRRGRDMSDQFPELVSNIRPIPQDFVADGELVILDDQGRPRCNWLHSRHTLRHSHRIREAATRAPAAIFAFDLLCLDGADFRPRLLLDRKAALHRTLPANRRIRYARHLNDDCEPLWDMAQRLDLEGIVAKDAASTRWQKIKTQGGTARELQRRAH
jgi:bifunctional non-homologous end joining protein LigD